MSHEDAAQSDVTPDEVGAAAVTFMDGLTEAFGMTGTSELTVDGTVLELNVAGAELGLLVGPGGRTLNAVQDLARVAAQRRLGDHETAPANRHRRLPRPGASRPSSSSRRTSPNRCGPPASPAPSSR